MASQRSQFITALGWVLAVFAGFTTVILALQSAVVFTMFDAELLQYVLDDMDPAPAIAIDGATLLRVMKLVTGSLLALGVVSLAASVGLLKRQEWARMFWVVMLAIGAVLHVIGAVVPFVIDLPVQALPEPAGTIMQVVTAVFALVFAALYAWLVKKLVEPAIAGKFARSEA